MSAGKRERETERDRDREKRQREREDSKEWQERVRKSIDYDIVTTNFWMLCIAAIIPTTNM